MPIDRRVFCAARPLSSPPRHGRSSRSRSRASGAPSCRSRSPAFATKTGAASRHRPSSAPTSASGAFRGVDNSAALDEGSQPVWGEWRARAADALVAGSAARLADGRFDLRFKLWDVVKGADLGGQATPSRPPSSPRRASHRRLRLREADRREGRVLDPDRLRHPGRLAAHAARRRCRRRQRPGRAQQRPADHLAGLVAGRQGARLRFVREAEGGGVRAHRRHRGTPRDRRFAARTAPRRGRTTARPGRHALARRRLAAFLHRQERREPAASPPARRSTPKPSSRSTAAGSTSPATVAAARRSTAWPQAVATPSASPSPVATTSARRSALTGARWPT